jgi:hypothetical protein
MGGRTQYHRDNSLSQAPAKVIAPRDRKRVAIACYHQRKIVKLIWGLTASKLCAVARPLGTRTTTYVATPAHYANGVCQSGYYRRCEPPHQGRGKHEPCPPPEDISNARRAARHSAPAATRVPGSFDMKDTGGRPHLHCRTTLHCDEHRR